VLRLVSCQSCQKVFFARLVLSFVALTGFGCAPSDVHVASVRPITVANELVSRSGSDPVLVHDYFVTAQADRSVHGSNRVSQQRYLQLAVEAWDDLQRNPNDASALQVFNQALANYLRFWSPAELALGQTDESVNGRPVKVLLREAAAPQRPLVFDQLIPSDDLRVKGVRDEYRRAGLGGLVVCQQEPAPGSPLDRFDVPEKLQEARTAVIQRVTPDAVEIWLYDPKKVDSVQIGGRSWSIGGDFTSPMAVMMSKTRFVYQRWQGFFETQHFGSREGIFFLEPYDPNKIPVVMIHGLLSTPLMWKNLTNRINADPVLQRHYQVWHVSYATGLPILTNAATLRSDLDRLNAALRAAGYPPHHKMVVIGHSMGGVLTKVLISDSGPLVWNAVFRVPPEQLHLSDADRAAIKELLFFKPRSDVGRAIFMASPFRGSNTANILLFRLTARLIQYPPDLTAMEQRVFRQNREFVVDSKENRLLTSRVPSSVDLLSPESAISESLANMQVARGVPFHLIIGIRGSSVGQGSSDGVVSYMSSHLDGAESEFLVHSGHSVTHDPKTEDEVIRILKENISGTPPTHPATPVVREMGLSVKNRGASSE
jgi:pimeloyl-ACP methyl ester carboxylesterase